MKTAFKTVLFGATAGALWSAVPGTLSELFRSTGETLSVIATGVITGVLVSLIVWSVFLVLGGRGTLLLGVISLPLGAFLFGILISAVHVVIKMATGTAYRFAQYNFDPLNAGLNYALGSLLSVFVLGLLPLAVFTTWCLQTVILPTNPKK
jgi:hypothetical protein